MYASIAWAADRRPRAASRAWDKELASLDALSKGRLRAAGARRRDREAIRRPRGTPLDSLPAAGARAYCDPYSAYYNPNYCYWQHRVYW